MEWLEKDKTIIVKLINFSIIKSIVICENIRENLINLYDINLIFMDGTYELYGSFQSIADAKKEIKEIFKNKLLPPFLWIENYDKNNNTNVE